VSIRSPFVWVAPPVDDSALAARLRHRSHTLWIGGPVPPGSDGITLGSLVVVRRAALHRDIGALLRHEQIHVAQFREHGVLLFLWVYVRWYVHFRLRGYSHIGAYRRIPFEIEARCLARRAGPRHHSVAVGNHHVRA
jgi:hypothetical protein